MAHQPTKRHLAAMTASRTMTASQNSAKKNIVESASPLPNRKNVANALVRLERNQDNAEILEKDLKLVCRAAEIDKLWQFVSTEYHSTLSSTLMISR